MMAGDLDTAAGGVEGDRAERPDRHSLPVAESVFDDRHGAVAAAFAAGKHHRRVDEGAHTHEHDDGVVASPAELTELVVPGRDRVRGGDASVGERDPGERGNGVRAGHTRNDVHVDAGSPDMGDLLPPRPKTNGSPPLSRTTRSRACSTRIALISSCGTG